MSGFKQIEQLSEDALQYELHLYFVTYSESFNYIVKECPF
jgi:hypothetical protein